MTATPDMAAGGPGPHLAGGRLTIDLAALAWNYRFLAQRSAPAQAAAVVKADAYGLGLAPAARTLWQAGCRRFFVALPHEGLALRAVLPEAEIFVFNGLFGAEAAAAARPPRETVSDAVRITSRHQNRRSQRITWAARQASLGR